MLDDGEGLKVGHEKNLFLGGGFVPELFIGIEGVMDPGRRFDSAENMGASEGAVWCVGIEGFWGLDETIGIATPDDDGEVFGIFSELFSE